MCKSLHQNTNTQAPPGYGIFHVSLYILKCSVKLRSLHFVSPSEKYVSTSCKESKTVLTSKTQMNAIK